MTELKIRLTNLFTGTTSPGTNTYKTNPVDEFTMDWFEENYQFRVDDYLDFLKLIPNGTLLNIQGYWGDVYLDSSLPDEYYSNGTNMGQGVKLVYKLREETITAIELHNDYVTSLTLSDDSYPFKSFLTEAMWARVFEEGILLWDITKIIKPKAVLTFNN
jgi:hypothetical protein